ncbi:MAG: hypothetical protein K0R05_4678 [Anaerocolumna sp.]|jgi:hypothetical protein|nr:hypothetical protein [Anaerocolumna sp.]
MVNDIVNGIVTMLESTFGEGILIYTEGVQKDFTMPCFLVKLIKGSRKQMMGNRFYLEHSFDIQYYPGPMNKNKEILEIVPRLSVLEYITSDGKLLRGTKLNYEITEEILHFYVQYNCFAYITKEEIDKMQSLTVKNGIGS